MFAILVNYKVTNFDPNLDPSTSAQLDLIPFVNTTPGSVSNHRQEYIPACLNQDPDLTWVQDDFLHNPTGNYQNKP